MSIENYFPLPNMRPKQRAVMSRLNDAIKSGYRFIFLEAPTGFGKSPVAVALARYLGSSHMCTATKDLQVQYSRDFPFIRQAMGKGNFTCIVKSEMGVEETCDYGPCQTDDSYDCIYKTRLNDYKVQGTSTRFEEIILDDYAKNKYVQKANKGKLVPVEWKPCSYYEQKWIGLKASHTIYNYKYFLSNLFYSGNIASRKLLILDEAHTLESEVSDFRSFTFYRDSLMRIIPRIQMPQKSELEVETWIDFGIQLKEELSKFIDNASGSIENAIQHEPYTEKNLVDALSREKTLSALIEDMKSNKQNWIVTTADKDSYGKLRKVVLTPLDTSNYFRDILSMGTIVLFMSATILSKDHLCSTAGLKSDQVVFIRIEESDFPVKNRPIRLLNIAGLNAKNMSQNLPYISRAINNIMDTHKKDKGIIHTTSYSQLSFIKSNLSRENAARLIETGPSFDRNEILQRHAKSSSPSVLISPSLYLGVDLKDDLSRFQIIVKVPYPDLNDKKVLAMKQRSPTWYNWNTILRLIQAYGRSIRSKDDFALTYILDSNISFLLRNAAPLVPRWFSEAIVNVS